MNQPTTDYGQTVNNTQTRSKFNHTTSIHDITDGIFRFIRWTNDTNKDKMLSYNLFTDWVSWIISVHLMVISKSSISFV